MEKYIAKERKTIARELTTFPKKYFPTQTSYRVRIPQLVCGKKSYPQKYRGICTPEKDSAYLWITAHLFLDHMTLMTSFLFICGF